MKKGLKISLIIIVLIIAVGATLMMVKSDYRVSRAGEINVPASYVYGIVSNHRNRNLWSPWEKIDPAMKQVFEGPESGVGASVQWESDNKDVGKGKLTIVEAVENEYTKSTLQFTEPFEANDIVEWKFKETDGVTRAEWISSGKVPLMFSLFMSMDDMLGPTFEEGISTLKTHCEGTYKAPEPQSEMSDSTNTEVGAPESTEVGEEG